MSKGLNVLVVEESAVALEQTTGILNSFGLAASGCNADSALDQIENRHFDGIFVDAALLGHSDVAQRARRSHVNHNTPIVFFGEDGSTSTMHQAFAAGATFYITRPTERNGFRRVVEVARLAMLEQRKRATSVPYTNGVAFTTNFACFSTPGISLSEHTLRVKRHHSLVLGDSVKLSFRLPDSSCLYAEGVVMTHDGMHTSIQLQASPLDRLRIRSFLHEQVH